jgi:hypothetical protein
MHYSGYAPELGDAVGEWVRGVNPAPESPSASLRVHLGINSEAHSSNP